MTAVGGGGGFLRQVRAGLDAAGVAYELDPHLVRGLDYYRHTAFEFVTDRLGAQGTVIAGGRYDGLIEQLGGPHTPAVGWAAGIERLAMMIDAPAAGSHRRCASSSRMMRRRVAQLPASCGVADLRPTRAVGGNMKKRRTAKLAAQALRSSGRRRALGRSSCYGICRRRRSTRRDADLAKQPGSESAAGGG